MFNAVTYFKTIATNLKVLSHTDTNRHYSRVGSIGEMEEFLANTRSIDGLQLVVLDAQSGRLDDSANSENLIDRSFHTFYILKKARVANFDEVEAIKKECLETSKLILGQMFKHKMDISDGLQNLNKGSVNYDSIGPIGQGYFGTMITFSLYELAGIFYNPIHWIDGQ